MKFLKKCKIKLAPHITHMINTILITKKFPRIFKISRIFPLSKPTLDRNFMESYRPVNNLCCLEKLAEAHILKYLEIFFEKNDIFEKKTTTEEGKIFLQYLQFHKYMIHYIKIRMRVGQVYY